MRQDAGDMATIQRSPWVGAEGTCGAQPILIRARQVLDRLVGSATAPFLLVITYFYESSDDTGLPSKEQYEQIASFEACAIDAMEAQGVGVVMLIRTSNGSVKYFCYVSGVDEAAAFFSKCFHETDHVEMASDNDPGWEEFRRQRGMTTGW